jgi:acyl-[acyl-carrier-protein]-phospholipid O-acyltransferase / long-chain-fatty-acid--[acyl-carrier-protein] ligase
MTEKIDRGEAKPAWGSFWALVGMQIQNSFTVSSIKFLLIPLGAWLASRHLGGKLPGVTEYVLSFLLVLPYLVLAPTAGWLADRFSKSVIIKVAGWVQWLIVFLLLGALWLRSLELAFFCFFLYSTQCCLLSPAKLGVVKELVGSKRLAFATGVVEGTVILAILAGQILGGLWFDRNSHHMDGWQAASNAMLWMIGIALAGALVAQMIHRTRSQSAEPFTPALMFRHWKDTGVVWKDRELRFCAVGTAYFWGFAGFVNLVVVEIAKHLHPDGSNIGTTISKMMVFASLGIAAGSVFAGMLSKRGIEWSLAPIGLILMSSGLFTLSQIDTASHLLPIFLAISGAGAAMFLVPLHTFVQDHPPADKRGTVISVSNFINNIGGITAVLVQFAMMKSGLKVQHQFFVLGVFTLIIAVIAIKKWLPEMLRVVILPIVRLIYRIRVLGDDHIPDKGGVLLLPNHVTWADSFFISAACHRRVRFVMYEGFMKTAGVSWFARLFDTVPISATKAKDAIRIVAEAIDNGDVVCLFAEGELTRTGCLLEIKRGFELMARKANCPVVPMWMDGAWGSLFSFERGKFFKKVPYSIPYGITVAIEAPIAAHDATIAVVRQSLCQASANALSSRAEKAGLLEKTNAENWVNGMQIGHVNAIQRKQEFALWEGDPTAASLHSFAIGFAGLFKNHVVTKEHDLFSVNAWVGGEATRQLLMKSSSTFTNAVFYDFDHVAAEVPVGILHCPCYVIQGIVIAMSMPDPPKGAATSDLQKGGADGSVGRLLPGFYIETIDDEQSIIKGPALPSSGLALPNGTRIDGHGFVFLPSAEQPA